MKSELLKAIITNECQLQSFSDEDITFACEKASTFFDEGNTFVESIHFGVSTAEKLNKN